MDIKDQDLKKALAEMDAKVTEESKETLGMLMERVLKQGMRPKTALNLSDEVMEGIYSHAYNMYNRGMYSEASHIFRLLIMLDPVEAKYLMGLGASLHMLKEYKDAAAMYLLCSAYDSENPLPHYHCADCFIKMDTPFDAVLELKDAIRKAGEKEEYAVLVERAQLMVESLTPEAEDQKKKFEEAVAIAEKEQAKIQAKRKKKKKKE